MDRLLLLSVFTLTIACSGGSEFTGENTNAFVGRFECTTTQSTSFAQPSTAQPSTISATSTATISEIDNGTIVLESKTGSGSTCELKFSADGEVATLDSGQSCTIPT